MEQMAFVPVVLVVEVENHPVQNHLLDSGVWVI
jgi:hypothetical protein